MLPEGNIISPEGNIALSGNASSMYVGDSILVISGVLTIVRSTGLLDKVQLTNARVLYASVRTNKELISVTLTTSIWAYSTGTASSEIVRENISQTMPFV